MPVEQIIRPAPVKDLPDQPVDRFQAWSSKIGWIIYGFAALLVVSLVYLAVTSQLEKSREKYVRESWDKFYLGMKDKEKEKPEVQIAALEKLWDELNGSPVQPFVALELAHLQFEEGSKPQYRPSRRKEHLERARDIYLTFLQQKSWSESKVYGGFAVEGAALALEQLGDIPGAVKILAEAVERESIQEHFLFPKLCYQLGRCYWLLVQQKESKKEDASAEKKLAIKRLGQAARETETSEETRAGSFEWRREALFLKALLEKPGEALPAVVPPPIEKKSTEEEAKAREAGAAKPAAKDQPTPVPAPAEGAKPAPAPAEGAKPPADGAKAAPPPAKVEEKKSEAPKDPAKDSK